MIEKLKQELAEILLKVKEGDEDALTAYIQLREAANVLDTAVESLKSQAYSVAESKIGAEHLGVKISMSKGRTTWDFKPVTAWSKLQEEFKLKLKEIEDVARNKFEQKEADPSIQFLSNEIPIKKVGEPFLSLTFPK